MIRKHQNSKPSFTNLRLLTFASALCRRSADEYEDGYTAHGQRNSHSDKVE